MLMRWKEIFNSKESIFITLLQDGINVTSNMCNILVKYVSEEDRAQQILFEEQASELEHDGDRIRTEILTRLNDTLITPFDREDINDLSRAIDDIADYIENSIKEISMYHIMPNEYIRDMVRTLRDAVLLLSKSIEYLKKNFSISTKLALQAKTMENKIEGIYRKGISNLTEDLEVHYLIKLREVYRHLSNAADRIDSAANRIITIAVKAGQ